MHREVWRSGPGPGPGPWMARPDWPPPPPPPPGWGPPQPPGPPPGWPPFGKYRIRLRRGRRGDVRAAILALLAEEPRNGYQIMQEIGGRSQGLWRPGSGSVYPALQQLQDEGLIRAEEREDRRVFDLTAAGREYVRGHQEALRAPWDAVAEHVDDRMMGLMEDGRQLGVAVMQVAQAGNEAQVGEARRIVAQARRALYQLLANAGSEGEDDEDDEGESSTATDI